MIETARKRTGKTIYWANLLHFYQPYDQKREIIDAIVEQCYRPVGEGILAHPGARLTINFTGVLLDQLAQYGHTDVIELYAEAVRRGQVELVGSGKYHAILALLSESEALRQIQINDETNRKYFGELYKPRGIFLPEMGYSPEMAPMLERAGFDWVLLDELAYDGHVGHVDYSKTYQIQGTKLKAFFREHRLSATIMSAAPRDVEQLKAAAREELEQDRYIMTAMDGETFGHHRVGHEQLLFAMFSDPEIQMVRVSDLEDKFSTIETVKTLACTWASSEDDIKRGIQFISWRDPKNEIHTLQWELLNLTARQMNALDKQDADYTRLRARLDYAVSSDQFFWASARPWWMIEHIERGAYTLLDILQHLPNVHPELAERGRHLYQEIMGLAYDWQRSGRIDEMGKKRDKLVRIPFREAAAQNGEDGRGHWRAVMELLKSEEISAAKRGNYEEAILWRDAAYKLEHGLDIYDAQYVIDILNKRLPKGEIEKIMATYKPAFNQIRGGQVEQRSN